MAKATGNTSVKASKKITPYQLFGWTPLLITVLAASTVAFFGVMNGMVTK